MGVDVMNNRATRIIFSREHNAWWAPDRRGYVNSEESAGRYTLREANDICYGDEEFHYVAPEHAEEMEKGDCLLVVIDTSLDLLRQMDFEGMMLCCPNRTPRYPWRKNDFVGDEPEVLLNKLKIIEQFADYVTANRAGEVWGEAPQ